MVTDAFKVLGWCPTAWQPMRSLDGWIVRVRPRCASISVQQWRVLAELAMNFAQPQIELTRLGNVQLRGVAEESLGLIQSRLVASQLIPAKPDADLAPPVHCTPLYHAQDATHAMAERLTQAVVEHLSPNALQLRGMAALPSKFGFAVDDAQRHLAGMKADISLWVSENGSYVMSVEGSGREVQFGSQESAVVAAIETALDFARDRMKLTPPPTRLRALVKRDARSCETAPDLPEKSGQPVLPGEVTATDACLIGVPFGRIDAAALLAVAAVLPEDEALRVTPWRSLMVSRDAQEKIRPLLDPAFWITRSDDARLRVSACAGAPLCEQAHLPTQDLALRIAPHVPARAHVHVSGCHKRCALSADATALVCGEASEAGVTQLHCSQPDRESGVFQRISLPALSDAPEQIQELIHDLHV